MSSAPIRWTSGSGSVSSRLIWRSSTRALTTCPRLVMVASGSSPRETSNARARSVRSNAFGSMLVGPLDALHQQREQPLRQVVVRREQGIGGRLVARSRALALQLVGRVVSRSS